MNNCGGRCMLFDLVLTSLSFVPQAAQRLLPQLTSRKFGSFRLIILMNAKRALMSHFCE